MMPPFSAVRRPSVVLGGIPGVWRELATRARLASETGIRHQLVRISQDVRHAYGERVHATAAEEMWQTAARACGAEVRNRSGNVLEITRNGLRTRVWGQTVPLNDEVAVHFAGDRFRLFAVLEEAGIPVPEFLGFRMRELGDAIEFLGRGPVPCVIKPAGSSSGFGVTAQLRDAKDVRLAARWAARFGDRLLIERQGEGAVFRLLVLDNVLIDAVRRHPPRITGDGCSTIARLVEREYERRLRLRANARGSRFDPITLPFVIDLDSLFTLRLEGLSPHSVLESGRRIRVKTVSNQNGVDDNEAALRGVSRKLASDAATIANAAGLRLAGIDVVTSNAGQSLAESGGIVIDVNPRPGLWQHYRIADPSAGTDVAAVILASLLNGER